VGRTPNIYVGTMIALNKNTGEVVWTYKTNSYMWSSPVAVYTEEGKGYIFQADASGNCYLLDGLTGEQLSYWYLGDTVESSPIAYGDRIVLGTRSGMYLFDID
jgi:outer membrane protein assembly factor BamB